MKDYLVLWQYYSQMHFLEIYDSSEIRSYSNLLQVEFNKRILKLKYSIFGGTIDEYANDAIQRKIRTLRLKANNLFGIFPYPENTKYDNGFEMYLKCNTSDCELLHADKLSRLIYEFKVKSVYKKMKGES